MRLGKVGDVNVITNASAICGGIVIAENVEGGAFAFGRLKD